MSGQYFDTETGLHYNYMRNYNPAFGRYGESDPLGLFAGMNTFAFVSDNSLSNRDPFGLNPAGKYVVPWGAIKSVICGPASLAKKNYEIEKKDLVNTAQMVFDTSECQSRDRFQLRIYACNRLPDPDERAACIGRAKNQRTTEKEDNWSAYLDAMTKISKLSVGQKLTIFANEVCDLF